MAEKIVSPGVFTKEIDQTFLPAAVQAIGAAVVGPTVKGPSMIPTVVTSYGDFQSKFGDVFKTGSLYTQYLTSMTAANYLRHADKLTVVKVMAGTYLHSTSPVVTGSGNYYTGSAPVPGTNVTQDANNTSFKLHTLSEGAIMNNLAVHSTAALSAGAGSKSLLKSGSMHNVRWEVSSVNPNKGTFTLVIRRGDDIERRKQILETWSNLTLDPNSNDFIEKRIGNTFNLFKGSGTNDPYIQPSGSYPANSKYVRVEVPESKRTIDYLDENGNVRLNSASSSLPGLGSGSFAGTFTGASNGYAGFDAGGRFEGSGNKNKCVFFEKIGQGPDAQDTQCFNVDTTTDATGGGAYADALNLLKNQDEYDINMILLPGLTQKDNSAIISKAIDVCEDRGDCFVIVDPVPYTTTSITEVTNEANDHDSNYAAMYWPWVQVPDNQTGTNRWVPPSVVMGGIYAFNDKIAHPWFAPAGLNRGGIETAIQAARKLTHANRDDLYESNVNPIATFPGQGVTVWGQKTLQKKASSLDRVNVRRLLISVKKFIASTSRFLVFEQNDVSTRSRFLNIVNPYLEQVQANSGLTAFRVVMDESNNTPDVVDRNILYGQIFVQPTRTAEFIVVDFTVQPTGATFPE